MLSVIKVEPCGKKFKVMIDGKPDVLLYGKDLKKYHISEDDLIEDFLCDELMDMLYQRAKDRALYIVEGSYKTTHEMRTKLERGLYPREIIDKVIRFLQEYGFIDDRQYALMYIERKRHSKSCRQIRRELYRKGIEKELIESAIRDADVSDELSLSEHINKRIGRYNIADKKELQKLYRYLLGKGYSYSDIHKALKDYITDEVY